MKVQRTPLAEYAAKRHALTAKRLGMTQGALSKAIRDGRVIYVTDCPDGSISAVEEKPFPGQRREPQLSEFVNARPSTAPKKAPEGPVNVSSTHQVTR
ncbi:Cro/Cl family transcriptional regulator [Pseudomonas asgharzadehiana]|uniref:Cro/Cl family transcriptional regulator n=1 Tax=Pseudomonas asgharzadehiana TaxID=2842349 RepID=A0ABX8P9F3_9PSED|nr:Cro/Cl family transcriptional regulator [Pseudomonas asgharzadehiana]